MTPFKCACFLLLVGILLAGLAVPAAAQPAPGDFSAVDEYVTETMRRLPIAGMSVAIVRGDQILYMQGYGVANQAGDPVTAQTPFMLASVTKTFTAMAVRQLAAAGKVNLADPVQVYLPEFTFKADPDYAAAITLWHLLDHTSGISTAEGTEPYIHRPESTFNGAISRLANYRPTHALGQQYEYSNWNYILLGEVISRVSGQTYAEYVQEHVLTPLQMTHASFADYHTLPGVATGHYISFGVPVPYDEKHIPLMQSAGYLTASAEDMAHYLIPYFNQGQYQGESLLPDQGQGWYDAIWNWQPGHPADLAYSFSGGHNSINTSIEMFAKHRVGVVVLMNTRFDVLMPGPNAAEIAFNIGRIVIGSPYQMPSSRSFYTAYALYDGFFLLAGCAIVWQGLRLKGFGKRFWDAPGKWKVLAWAGIAIDLLVTVGLLALPIFTHSNWRIMLYHRADTAVALLAVGVLLAALAIFKTILILKTKEA